jgi:hypothetical protein
MNVLRHHDITHHHKAVALTGLFQDRKKPVAAASRYVGNANEEGGVGGKVFLSATGAFTLTLSTLRLT